MSKAARNGAVSANPDQTNMYKADGGIWLILFWTDVTAVNSAVETSQASWHYLGLLSVPPMGPYSDVGRYGVVSRYKKSYSNDVDPSDHCASDWGMRFSLILSLPVILSPTAGRRTLRFILKPLSDAAQSIGCTTGAPPLPQSLLSSR